MKRELMEITDELLACYLDGKLTGEGLEMLKKALPKADLEEFSKNPVIQNLAKVLSVKDLVNLVSTKLA